MSNAKQQNIQSVGNFFQTFYSLIKKKFLPWKIFKMKNCKKIFFIFSFKKHVGYNTTTHFAYIMYHMETFSF